MMEVVGISRWKWNKGEEREGEERWQSVEEWKSKGAWRDGIAWRGEGELVDGCGRKWNEGSHRREGEERW